MKRAAIALSLLVSAAAFAQSADNPAIFGSTSAGQIDAIAKRSSGLSGSLSISASSGAQSGKGYGATFGGTIVPDKAWFFASALRTPSITQTFGLMPTATNIRTFDANAIAQIGDRQTLDTNLATTTTLPKNFLSMHYTGIISPNAFFTASVSSTR